MLAQATHELCISWFERYYELVQASQLQQGKTSHYPRRNPTDSQLDAQLSLQTSLISCELWIMLITPLSSIGKISDIHLRFDHIPISRIVKCCF